jgi:carbamoyltransferase
MMTLGISCYYHDSAVCLMDGDKILFAAQEERYSRVKHDSNFPKLAIERALEFTGVKAEEITTVVFYEKPFLSYERVIETVLELGGSGFPLFYDSLTKMLRTKLFFKSNFNKSLRECGLKSYDLKFSEHHYSHALSAFLPSPFESAVVVCMDGVGEWDTTTIWQAKGTELKKMTSMEYPHSIGLFYSMFTEYCGFKSNSGEYKLMGLAPYGKPKYVELIKEKFIKINDDGSVILNLNSISPDFRSDKVMNSMTLILGQAPRGDAELNDFYMDIAASVQVICEEVVELVVDHAMKISGERNLCLAGGVALNCVANGKLAKKIGWDKVWVQPAAGDCGGALGAALSQNKYKLTEFDPYLGESYDFKRIIKVLEEKKINYDQYSTVKVIEDLKQDKVVAVFDGRMEFGPRALGSRSILARASTNEMKDVLNAKVKKREGFRPFAPIVLDRNSKSIFNLESKSPYMLFTTDVKENTYPATTHINDSARVQTIESTGHKVIQILEELEKQTNEVVLVNTSFNIRGEPIVSSPENALDCFFDSGIDCLILGDYYIRKVDNLVSYEFYTSRDFKED